MLEKIKKVEKVNGKKRKIKFSPDVQIFKIDQRAPISKLDELAELASVYELDQIKSLDQDISDISNIQDSEDSEKSEIDDIIFVFTTHDHRILKFKLDPVRNIYISSVNSSNVYICILLYGNERHPDYLPSDDQDNIFYSEKEPEINANSFDIFCNNIEEGVSYVNNSVVYRYKLFKINLDHYDDQIRQFIIDQRKDYWILKNIFNIERYLYIYDSNSYFGIKTIKSIYDL